MTLKDVFEELLQKDLDDADKHDNAFYSVFTINSNFIERIWELWRYFEGSA